MNIYSARFPIMIIIILLAVLVVQFITNDKSDIPTIDAETCELYIIDSKINAKQYLNEFDEKCLEFKNLNP